MSIDDYTNGYKNDISIFEQMAARKTTIDLQQRIMMDVDEKIHNFKEEFKFDFLKRILRFFEIDFATAEQVLELLKGDNANQEIAINMILGIIKSKQK